MKRSFFNEKVSTVLGFALVAVLLAYAGIHATPHTLASQPDLVCSGTNLPRATLARKAAERANAKQNVLAGAGFRAPASEAAEDAGPCQ
jgi:hypothetical protein